LKGILRNPITAPIMQNGELKALKPQREESCTAWSSPHSWSSKKPVSLCMA